MVVEIMEKIEIVQMALIWARQHPKSLRWAEMTPVLVEVVRNIKNAMGSKEFLCIDFNPLLDSIK